MLKVAANTYQFRLVGITKQPSMHSRKFESKAALVAYAEQNGLTCLMESFAKWRGRLSPEQYDVVEVRTSRGLKSAMLLPKAVLKAAWETDPLRKALIPERDSACFRRKRHHVG